MTCRLETLQATDTSLIDQAIALLETEHDPDPSGCAACRALALLRDGVASVVFDPTKPIAT